MGIGSAMCSLCGDVEGDIIHVLHDCLIVMPIWLAVVHTNKRTNFFDGDLD